jgi:hypothetical protein
MSREEDLIRSTTRAIASTVREVPPLQLERAADKPRSWARAPHRARGPRGSRRPGGRGGRERRRHTWLAPVTAAAAVVALAVALVLVKDLPNGGSVPAGVGVVPTADSSLASPSGSGAGSVPPYYVAIQTAVTKPTGKPPVLTTPLVVGDSRTGQKLATIAPPTGVRFLNVTAANDDRTFVAAGQQGSGASATIELFEIRLDLGAAHPAQMTSLPIGPQPVGSAKSIDLISDSFPVALSGSGTELAVAEFTGTGAMTVKVFSVATGSVLREWTTADPDLSLSGLSEVPTLTWIDGDRALALATLGAATNLGNKDYVAWQTVRRLDLNGPAGSGPLGGSLIADSTVLRSVRVGGEYGTRASCGYMLQWPPVISADGKTFTCTTGSAFFTYPLTAGAAAGGPGTLDLTTGDNDFVNTLLWTNTSGNTLVAEWGVSGNMESSSNPTGVQISVVSQGKSTPLRFPSDFSQPSGGGIAW